MEETGENQRRSQGYKGDLWTHAQVMGDEELALSKPNREGPTERPIWKHQLSSIPVKRGVDSYTLYGFLGSNIL